jgi:hypothetical protein
MLCALCDLKLLTAFSLKSAIPLKRSSHCPVIIRPSSLVSAFFANALRTLRFKAFNRFLAEIGHPSKTFQPLSGYNFAFALFANAVRLLRFKAFSR